MDLLLWYTSGSLFDSAENFLPGNTFVVDLAFCFEGYTGPHHCTLGYFSISSLSRTSMVHFKSFTFESPDDLQKVPSFGAEQLSGDTCCNPIAIQAISSGHACTFDLGNRYLQLIPFSISFTPDTSTSIHGLSHITGIQKRHRILDGVQRFLPAPPPTDSGCGPGRLYLRAHPAGNSPKARSVRGVPASKLPVRASKA